MKFSTRIRYGIRTMMEIGMNSTEDGVFQKDISERQQISNKYLDHIITSLKVSRLIVNAKGKKSGYLLTRAASEITLLDIHNAFEPGINVVDCLVEGYVCDKRGFCASEKFWCKLNFLVNEHFKNTTLQMMIDQQNGMDEQKKSKELHHS